MRDGIHTLNQIIIQVILRTTIGNYMLFNRIIVFIILFITFISQAESKDNPVEMTIKNHVIKFVNDVSDNNKIDIEEYIKFPVETNCSDEIGFKSIKNEEEFYKLKSYIFDQKLIEQINKWKDITFESNEITKNVIRYTVNINIKNYDEINNFLSESSVILMFEPVDKYLLLTKIYCAG